LCVRQPDLAETSCDLDWLLIIPAQCFIRPISASGYEPGQGALRPPAKWQFQKPFRTSNVVEYLSINEFHFKKHCGQAICMATFKLYQNLRKKQKKWH